MFLSLKQRLLIGVYIFIIVSIPIGAYLAQEAKVFKSSANENKPVSKSTPKSTLSPAQSLLKDAENKLLSSSPTPVSKPSPDSSTTTTATSFGPTLSLKITIEGRQSGNYATKLFIGIVEGALGENPKFLLSFTVDLPSSGEYSNLSLAGLSPGTNYTAMLKGDGQISASSSFTMSPAVTNLNNGAPINMLSGDLNEDNVVNSADLAILESALGATPKSSNWNQDADYNGDGIINMFDLAILSNNVGKVGASGAWTSPVPKISSPSASLTSPAAVGGPNNNSGYWMWVPKGP